MKKWLNGLKQWFVDAPALMQLFLINMAIFVLVPTKWIGALAVYQGNFGASSLFQWLTAAFLHGSWLHLLGNFVFAAPFALYLEDKIGKKDFYRFYLTCAFTSSLLWILSGLIGVDGGAIGSSGAIYGVVAGAMLMFNGTSQKRALAALGLGFIISFQFLLSVVSFILPVGIAYLGHLGGILGALVAMPLFFKK